MTDKEGKVIYIGKAKNLKKRVTQYFKKDYQHSSRTKKLLENLYNIECIGTDTELEATILELNLLKQLQPKYNVIMKDGKSFVYIKITKNEDFPRIQIVRDVKKDGAKYIGPKTAAHKVKETFKILKKIFPFRHCNLGIKEKNGKITVTKKTIKYPCIDYYIKRCAAPCINEISKENYAKIIQGIEDFLNGKEGGILKELEKQMKEFAKNKQFEKAAKTRDRIEKAKSILEKQKMEAANQDDKDIINYCISHGRAYFNLFQIRENKLIGQENFILHAAELEEDDSPEALSAFVKQYYELATNIPKTVLIPHKIENKSDFKFKFEVPQKGIKDKLLSLSLKNAIIYADRNKPSWQKESALTEEAAQKLQKILKLKTPLKRIECYDISHLGGTDTVGSMIVFTNGAPATKMYRKFRLRTVQNKPDDYKSMEEVLLRRFGKISQIIQHKDYKFKKSRKKDQEFIEKNNNIKLDKTNQQFYILEKGKKQIGIITIQEHSNKITELANLWIQKKSRGHHLGYKLIKEAIKKAKSKRIYVICKKDLTEYYMLAGFEPVRKVPAELESCSKTCSKKGEATCLVYDKIKSKEDDSFSRIPDLVVIDGGKGQLAVAEKVLNKLSLKIPHIALAKRLEEIHSPGKIKPIALEKNNEALQLLQRARDEAHRFAITYNKTLRKKHFS